MSYNVLHIFDHSIPLHSGYTFRSRQILRHQQQLGIQTIHLTGIKHTVAEAPIEQVDGLEFHRTFYRGWMNHIPILNQWAVISSLKKSIAALIKTHKIDIIHAHSPALNGFAAVKIGQQCGIPVVYEVRAFWEDAAVDHGSCREGDLRYRISAGLETFVLQHCQAITTICEGLRKDIISRGIDESKITTIPNAVDLDSFQADQTTDSTLQSELELTGKTVLGFIGSFYHYEGLTTLIQAMPDIIASDANVTLLLVGGGNEEAGLKTLVAELNLTEQVIFCGRVPHEEVQRYYSLVDVFVYPRLSMRLTELVTPLKPLEAMAQKKLVVASDVGGHRELIQDGKTGFLFAANDSVSLAKTVLKTLSNRHNWAQIQQAGRAYVEQERNWKAVTTRYLPIYQQFLSHD